MIEATQWLKVMLDEIERKRQEHKEAEQEMERRGDKAASDSAKNSA